MENNVVEDAASLNQERIAYLEGVISQARTAAAAFRQSSQEDVDRIVKPIVLASMENAQHLARMAIEETRLGVLEDKVIKNMVATEFVYNYVKTNARWVLFASSRNADWSNWRNRSGSSSRSFRLRTQPLPPFSNASWPSRLGTLSFSVLIRALGAAVTKP